MRGILNILEDDTPVGAICADRIYVNKIPEDIANLPCVMIERQGREVNYTASGASDLDEITYQVTSFSTSSKQADDLADAVRTALEAKAAGTYDTQVIAGIDIIDDSTTVFSVSDKNVHMVEQVYTVYERQ